MAKRTISDLPPQPYQKYAMEAERRGIKLTEVMITDATSVILIGALDMIRELYERIERLEASNKTEQK